jgi:hypothetical protein
MIGIGTVIETMMMTTTTTTMMTIRIGRGGGSETAIVSTMTIGGGDAVASTGSLEVVGIAGSSRNGDQTAITSRWHCAGGFVRVNLFIAFFTLPLSQHPNDLHMAFGIETVLF